MIIANMADAKVILTKGGRKLIVAVTCLPVFVITLSLFPGSPCIAEQLNCDNVSSNFDSANQAFDSRDFSNAINLLKTILPCAPEEEKYRYVKTMSQAYLERGKTSLIKGDIDSAISDFSQSLDLTPNSTIALYYRGISYCIINDVNSQQDVIVSLLSSGFIDGSSYYGEREHKEYQDTNFEQYVSECKQDIKKTPDDAEAYFNLGFAYHQKGEYSLATKYYLKAIEKNPEFADAYYNMGHIARFTECHDEAIRYFAEAVNIDINDRDSLLNLGNAYYRKGILLLSVGFDEGITDIFTKAIDSYNKVLIIDSDEFNTRLYRGKSLLYIGLYDEAINDFTNVINTVPQYNDAYFSRGNAFFYKKDYKNAIDDYSKAISLGVCPDPFKYYLARGDAYFLKGDVSAAIEDYTTAIEETHPVFFRNYHPFYSEAYRKRGIAFKELGEPQKSIDDLNKYLEFNPYCDDRKMIEQIILVMSK